MLNHTVNQEGANHINPDDLLTSTCYLSNNLKVEFDEDKGILHVKWQGKVKSKVFREGYTQILRLVRIQKPRKWVLDLSNRESIQKDDQLWVFKNIFPQLLRMLNCDVFIAVILPVNLYENLVNGLDGDDFIYKDNLLIMQHFLYYEESLRWLQEVEVLSEGA